MVHSGHSLRFLWKTKMAKKFLSGLVIGAAMFCKLGSAEAAERISFSELDERGRKVRVCKDAYNALGVVGAEELFVGMYDPRTYAFSGTMHWKSRGRAPIAPQADHASLSLSNEDGKYAFQRIFQEVIGMTQGRRLWSGLIDDRQNKVWLMSVLWMIEGEARYPVIVGENADRVEELWNKLENSVSLCRGQDVVRRMWELQSPAASNIIPSATPKWANDQLAAARASIIEFLDEKTQGKKIALLFGLVGPDEDMFSGSVVTDSGYFGDDSVPSNILIRNTYLDDPVIADFAIDGRYGVVTVAVWEKKDGEEFPIIAAPSGELAGAFGLFWKSRCAAISSASHNRLQPTDDYLLQPLFGDSPMRR
jgi:hypothetical protein